MALRGIRVLELAGLAPVPYCGMVLADFGAQVIRIDRPSGRSSYDGGELIDSKLGRGKQSISIDLKLSEGREIVTKLAAKSDVLIEPFRAGVMEKLGLGPDKLIKVNPQLIYARLTGYGQTGPINSHAGHDINYLAYSGLLWAFNAPGSKPHFPINLMADFAGGGLLCSFAVSLALLQRHVTGRGQVIDLNMTNGAAYVASWLWRSRNALPFVWSNPNEPGKNLLDGGRAFYNTYKTKDGRFVAIGAIEPKFFQALLEALEVPEPKSFDQFGNQNKLRQQFEAIFIQKDRDHWAEVARRHPNSCLSPVLTLDEAPNFDHAKAAKSFVRKPDQLGGGFEPSPTPIGMSTLDGREESPYDPKIGQHTRSVLTSLLEMSNEKVDELCDKQIVKCTD